jgi:hypothetical protein
MGEKLTKRMRDRLEEIAACVPDERWPLPAYWHSMATDRALVKRGMIERVEHTTTLGGEGNVSKFTAVWHLCRVTPAGRLALESAHV